MTCQKPVKYSTSPGEEFIATILPRRSGWANEWSSGESIWTNGLEVTSHRHELRILRFAGDYIQPRAK